MKVWPSFVVLTLFKLCQLHFWHPCLLHKMDTSKFVCLYYITLHYSMNGMFTKQWSLYAKCLKYESIYYWWLVRVTLAVPFFFLPQNFERWQGVINGTLSFYECKFSGGDSMMLWEHSNPSLCARICLNSLFLQVEGMHKNFPHAGTQGLKPSLMPGHEHSCPSTQRATRWNFHYLIFSVLAFVSIK